MKTIFDDLLDLTVKSLDIYHLRNMNDVHDARRRFENIKDGQTIYIYPIGGVWVADTQPAPDKIC